jgi:hypothetical protein
MNIIHKIEVIGLKYRVQLIKNVISNILSLCEKLNCSVLGGHVPRDCLNYANLLIEKKVLRNEILPFQFKPFVN